MTELIAPLTKLDAVNICLSSMGEPVINSLDDAAVDAQMASAIVDETTRSVQAACWHWNKETHTLSPDSNGFIVLPANTLRIDPTSLSGVDAVQRGLRLFDLGSNTFTFRKPVQVDLWVTLTYDEVPFAAKQFIAISAARKTQQRLLGSETLYKFDAADEQKAWVVLMQEEAQVADHNVLRDNWSTSSIMTRGFFSRGLY